MNKVDHDKKHCNKDAYGNVTAKNQEGITVHGCLARYLKRDKTAKTFRRGLAP